jgi:hypothetical protein
MGSWLNVSTGYKRETQCDTVPMKCHSFIFVAQAKPGELVGDEVVTSGYMLNTEVICLDRQFPSSHLLGCLRV